VLITCPPTSHHGRYVSALFDTVAARTAAEGVDDFGTPRCWTDLVADPMDPVAIHHPLLLPHYLEGSRGHRRLSAPDN
jgi:hypothetical protein